MDGQLRDGAVDWADETLEAAALDRLGQLLLAQPRLALGLGEIGEDARARLGGGLPRIATSHRDLRLRLAGRGAGGIPIARGDATRAAHPAHAPLRAIAFLHHL